MNIISNTCIGSFITRDFLKTPYNNPFCWNIIDSNSICSLIENYDKINFNNYELLKGYNLPNYMEKYWNMYIKIDNKINVYYIHYRFNPLDTKPRKAACGLATDVFYNKIWEYIVEKYETRIKRMKEQNEKPIFVLGSSWPAHSLSYKMINKISKIKTNYKIIMASTVDIDFDLPINCYYYKHEVYKNNKELSKQIYEKYIK